MFANIVVSVAAIKPNLENSIHCTIDLINQLLSVYELYDELESACAGHQLAVNSQPCWLGEGCVVVLYCYIYYCCFTTFGLKGGSSTGFSIMAHIAFGHIQEFDPNVEGTSSYLERVGLYFVANKIESGRQVAVFLSLIGGKNYALLRDLLLPQQPKDKSLDELISTLRRHFEPKQVVIAEYSVFA